MKTGLRVALYAALIAGVIFFLTRFRGSYHRSTAAARAAQGAIIDGATGDIAPNPALAKPLTNEPGTAGESTNTLPDTLATNTVGEVAGASNRIAKSTSRRNAVDRSGQTAVAQVSAETGDRSESFVNLALLIFCFLALGGLFSWDLVHWLGNRAGRTVMAEDYLPPTDAAYEAAEAEWAKGRHIDAIGLMREYLKRNPSEQHVAIRIAEIYEKDLGNPLAAALELEEVLGKKLPPEKWGWTAIHLANLFSGKLNKADKALAWLERIVAEHPQTQAAGKARQRLGLAEPGEAPAQSLAETPAADSNPALPPGFSAKK